jgi:phosphoribosylformylglycinamidine synthase
LAKEKALQDALLAFIRAGLVKSAHDCSEGGLAVALAECCISNLTARGTPRLIGAHVDLSNCPSPRLDALLFGETQSRIIITASAAAAGQVIAQAKRLGIQAEQIGKVGGDELALKMKAMAWTWEVEELHDLWWNAIALAMSA